MSSRRSRSRNNTPGAGAGAGAGSGSRISEDELNDLVSKLHQILPRDLRDRCSSDKVSAARVLQETCNYIRSLNREVDGLSERLSDLLENSDTTQAALIRSLLTQ